MCFDSDICLCAQCTDSSRELSASTYRDIITHTLMADTVSPSGGQPLYYSKEFAFTKMSADHVFSYTVLHLYNPGPLTLASWL